MDDLNAWYPTRLNGTCGGCGTETTCEHPNGIDGEGRAWPCPVCGNPVRMDGSNYTIPLPTGDPYA